MYVLLMLGALTCTYIGAHGGFQKFGASIRKSAQYVLGIVGAFTDIYIGAQCVFLKNFGAPVGKSALL